MITDKPTLRINDIIRSVREMTTTCPDSTPLNPPDIFRALAIPLIPMGTKTSQNK